MDLIEYTKLLDSVDLKRPKCKCCGNDIIYDNTTAKFYNSKLIIKGKSFNTIKVVNGVEYRLSVCQSCLTKLYPNIKNLNRTFNVMSKITKFAFNIPDLEYATARRRYAMTKDNMIKKYGEVEGSLKWQKYCEKQAKTNTFEYKHLKYGMTKEEFDDYNKSRACTLHNFILREGETAGKLHWDKYCERQRETKTIEYMIAQKSDEEINRILNCRMQGINSAASKSYSKLSQEFFKIIDLEILKINPNYHTYYHDKNFEYPIQNGYNTYFLDYYILELNVCIEFFGDFWHANPSIYKSGDVISIKNKKYNVEDIWAKDANRINTLKQNHNILTYIIWESDVNRLNINEFINILLHENCN